MKRVSKGYQDKILIDGYWYKVDRLGTEGLSEEIATIVLRESNITSAFVEYEYCDFEYRGKLVHGCKSKNFLMPYESIVSLFDFLQYYQSEEDIDELFSNISCKERIDYTIDVVKQLGSIDISIYLKDVLALDYLIRNDDRHWGNLSVIYDRLKNTYKSAPIYDNAAGLLSDYNYSKIEDMLNILALPFSIDFKTQAYALDYTFKYNRDKILKLTKESRCKDALIFSMNAQDVLNIIPESKRFSYGDNHATQIINFIK